jgi:hypothetical protein
MLALVVLYNVQHARRAVQTVLQQVLASVMVYNTARLVSTQLMWVTVGHYKSASVSCCFIYFSPSKKYDQQNK